MLACDIETPGLPLTHDQVLKDCKNKSKNLKLFHLNCQKLKKKKVQMGRFLNGLCENCVLGVDYNIVVLMDDYNIEFQDRQERSCLEPEQLSTYKILKDKRRADCLYYYWQLSEKPLQ